MRSNQPVPPTVPVRDLGNETNIEEESDETDNEEEHSENVDDATEAKPILIAVQMDANDVLAIIDLIADENVVDLEGNLTAEENNEIDQSAITNDNHEQSAANNDSEPPSTTNKKEVKKTEIIDDDIEITYVEGQVLLPSVESTPMVPKTNDILSGNMPYQAILDRQDVSI